jgi:hypothetical protein
MSNAFFGSFELVLTLVVNLVYCSFPPFYYGKLKMLDKVSSLKF